MVLKLFQGCFLPTFEISVIDIPLVDFINKNVVDTLKKNYEMLQRNREDHKEIMEKLDEGLEAMKQKYLEDKLRAQYEQKETFKNTRS